MTQPAHHRAGALRECLAECPATLQHVVELEPLNVRTDRLDVKAGRLEQPRHGAAVEVIEVHRGQEQPARPIARAIQLPMSG